MKPFSGPSTAAVRCVARPQNPEGFFMWITAIVAAPCVASCASVATNLLSAAITAASFSMPRLAILTTPPPSG